MDILPYKYSAFASYNNDPTGTIDVMKIMLVIYTVTICSQNFKNQKSFSLLSFMTDNFIDLMIIFLQTYCFCIKCQDAVSFNIDPSKILDPENRFKYISLHFIANNFRNFCIMETIGLIFVALKMIDGLRILQRVNVIVLTLSQSTRLL